MIIIFNAEYETNNIIKFIKEYYKTNNLDGAIIGISGGKDSLVVVALLMKALGKNNIIGVTMPCYSKKEDMAYAKLISDYYGFKLINFNITRIFDSFKNELNNIDNFDDKQTKNSDINVKPRLRMTTLYYLAALYTKVHNRKYIVIGTSNKSEMFVGYFTKYGDSGCDLSLIGDLTVDEVIKIGEYLNVPKKILYKVPDDGLSNQTDEEKLGVTYKDIEKYMNGEKIDISMSKKISKLHNSSKHKFNVPMYKKGQ